MDMDFPRLIEYIRLITSNQIGKIIVSSELFINDKIFKKATTNKTVYSRGDSALTLIDAYNKYKYNECTMCYEAGYITLIIFE